MFPDTPEKVYEQQTAIKEVWSVADIEGNLASSDGLYTILRVGRCSLI